MASTVGQLLPGDPELDDPAARPTLRRKRSRRVPATRSDRWLPRGLHLSPQPAGPRRDRRPPGQPRWRRLPSRHDSRTDADAGLGRLVGCVPISPSARGGPVLARLGRPARQRRLSQPGPAPARSRPDRGQRAVGLSAGRRASTGGPNRRPRLRQGTLGATPDRCSRHPVVDDRDWLSRPSRRGVARACGPPDQQRAGHRTRRWLRPPFANPAGPWRHAHRPPVGRRGLNASVRIRSCRHGCLGRRAQRRVHGRRSASSWQSAICRRR